MGIRPEPDADLPGAIRELTAGRLERGKFMQHFGHRGHLEMELSQPRWSEDPGGFDRLASGPAGVESGRQDPQATWSRVADEAKLSAAERARLESEWQSLRTFMSLRETAKHHLMKGYALIRRILVELDRRYELHGGIFFLTPGELPELHRREHVLQLIAERRRRREIALSLELPQVLFSDDLEALGRSVTPTAAETLQGVPISAGIAEGPALVLHEPTNLTAPTEAYILVCPTTDPAWVPLFMQAKGLVMETGGVLSHGAIVAREFGLPAVAGIPDVQRRLRTGQRLRVDGASGKVTVLT